MAPVATNENGTAHANGKTAADLKALKEEVVAINPFYSPSTGDDGDDEYEHKDFKPSFPDVKWDPLADFEVPADRGFSADPEKKALLSAATQVKQLTPAIGTLLLGIDLRQLTDQQKDELALLVAERGVVFFRDQEINIHEQLDLGRHFGPLHRHATTPIPKAGLDEVHVVYNDHTRRPDLSTFSGLELWHSDVSYERQPPTTTSLKVIAGPEYGGDTLWNSGYALYSSLSAPFQKYLEGLTALHSAVQQAEGARAAGLPVRRYEIETIHPIVRVHPVTGWKAIYVNPGFTRRILGVPKAESDAILQFLFRQISENPDNQVRFSWEPNSIAIWDNRVTQHSATFDFWPARRHALRVTPQGERPLSVEAYEQKTGKEAKDRQKEIYKQKGLNVEQPVKPRSYND